MQDFIEKIKQLDAQVYQSIKTAVELGKWETGIKLAKEQLELCMQILIIWEEHNLPADQHTGFMADKCKSSSDNDNKQSADKNDDQQEKYAHQENQNNDINNISELVINAADKVH